VAVEHDLNTEGRVAAHLDGHVPPFGIDDVEVVVVDVGPGLAAIDVEAPLALDLPYQRRCLGDEDKENPDESGVRRQMAFRQAVLVRARGAVDDGNPAFRAVRVDATAEGARHAVEMVVVEGVVRAGQVAPPAAQATRLLGKNEVAVQHDAVHGVVAARDQTGVV